MSTSLSLSGGLIGRVLAISDCSSPTTLTRLLTISPLSQQLKHGHGLSCSCSETWEDREKVSDSVRNGLLSVESGGDV
jgi:hypothetical protein